MVRMPAEHRSIRLIDTADPERQEKFNRALRQHTANGNAVLRRLVDAWLLHIEEHGHAPKFPVRLQPFEPPET